MGRKLYVGNFPYETGEAELQELFARAGTVETVKVMRDMATGRARGFAFVEMGSDDEAQKAIAELNEYQLGGRSLSVNEARPKPAYAGGGSAAANRDVAPSRVGKQVRRPWGGRAPALPLHRLLDSRWSGNQRSEDRRYNDREQFGRCEWTRALGSSRVRRGKNISFTRALSMARASPICARVMESSSRLPTARRVRGRRTSSAPRRKRTELEDRVAERDKR